MKLLPPGETSRLVIGMAKVNVFVIICDYTL